MNKKYAIVEYATFPDKRYIFFKTHGIINFAGILDFTSKNSTPIKTLVLRRGEDVTDLHLSISKAILSCGYVKRVSFYGGGMEILLHEECQITYIGDLVKRAIEKSIKGLTVYVVPERSVR